MNNHNNIIKDINQQINHYNSVIKNGDYDGYVGLGMIYDPRFPKFMHDKDVGIAMEYYKKAVEHGARTGLISYGVSCAEHLNKPKLASCYIWVAYYNEVDTRAKQAWLKYYNLYKKYLSYDEQNRVEQFRSYEDIQKYAGEFEDFVATDMKNVRIKNDEYYHPEDKFNDIQYTPIKYGSSEWKLYHYQQNKELLPELIGLTVLLFFFKGGLLFLVILWSIYISWCICNNEKMNKDPVVLKKRQEYKRSRMIFPKDPNHPLYKTPYYQDNPQYIPGTPENIAYLNEIKRRKDEDFLKK